VKAKELRELTIEELGAKEKEVQETLFNLRFQHATGLLENTMRIPATRKDLARIKTVLKAKKALSGKRKGTV
jgi:large subunit ribosomal protein L29